MNVPRRLIGRYVEIQWMDPHFNKVELLATLRGRIALATWIERGVIVDVHEGVVKVEHSLGIAAGQPITNPNEHAYTAIPEALIEKIETFTKDGAGAEPTTTT
jgi:hypothetical protein